MREREPAFGIVSRCLSDRGGVHDLGGGPAGRHRLEVRDPRGAYEPVPPREVEIQAGKRTVVTLDLVPRQVRRSPAIFDATD